MQQVCDPQLHGLGPWTAARGFFSSLGSLFVKWFSNGKTRVFLCTAQNPLNTLALLVTKSV